MAFDKVVDSSVLNAKLLNIANALRKGTGQSRTMADTEMPFAASEIDTSGYGKLPSYWNNAVNTAISTIRGLQADPDNIPLFAYFSDCHIRPNTTTPNPGYTGTLAAMVMNACQIPFAMCCGDSARSDGNGLTEESQMIDCFDAANRNFAPIGWHRLVQTQGNHDGSWGTANGKAYAYQMDSEQLYDYIYRKQKSTNNHVFGDGDNSYFYVDDTDNKIRIIMLNSLWCEMPYNADGTAAFDRQHYFGYGQAQLTWLANTALNVGSDWVIFIGTHIPPLDMYRGESYQEYRTKWTRDIELLRGILSAYENKTAYSGSYTKNTSRGEGDWANVSVSVNFSDAMGKIAGFYCGHCHTDTINIGDLPFPVITITSDGDISYDGTEENRVLGTDNEHAIDFVTIKKVTQSVTLTRLGVGASRAYSYKGIVLYAVSNNLTNVTTSNSVTSVEGDTAYTATLTVKDGYEKLTVSVKMGGVDITSTAYSNGVVNITKVTGDIVITASATKKASYTNLADPTSADWSNDDRLSSSATNKGPGTNPGHVVTNWIDCVQGDVIRVKGIDILDGTSGYAVHHTTKNTAVKLSSFTSHFTTDSNGVISCTVATWVAASTQPNITKLRFSGKLTAASADDVIITKNEVIE
jgi:hypothetical protein